MANLSILSLSLFFFLLDMLINSNINYDFLKNHSCFLFVTFKSLILLKFGGGRINDTIEGNFISHSHNQLFHTIH